MAKTGAFLEQALKPFADFYVQGAPDDIVITKGSPLAKRQLTMRDCRIAKEALDG